MQIYDFTFYILVIVSLHKKAQSKSIFGSRISSDRDDREDRASLYPVKRRIPNSHPDYRKLHEVQSDMDEVDFEPVADPLIEIPHMKKLVDVPNYGANNILGASDNMMYERRAYRPSLDSELDLKRSQLSLRKDKLQKRELFEPTVKRQSPYGIVYGNGKPVGILEPYPPSFELSSLDKMRELDTSPLTKSQSQIVDILYPVNKGAPEVIEEESETGETDGENSMKGPDKKYKIKRNYEVGFNKDFQKRSMVSADTGQVAAEMDPQHKLNKRYGVSQEKLDELKMTLSKLQHPLPEDNIEMIEDNLKDLLEDMGLLDDTADLEEKDIEKREDQAEDEDMERGANKIQLTKDTESDRAKREENHKITDKSKELSANAKLPDSQLKEDMSNDSKFVTEDTLNENNNNNEGEEDPEISKREVTQSYANYEAEGDAFIRQKRQEKQKKENNESENDIMKGLEKSGELTVSGNKSPLASKTDTTEEEKRKITTSKPMSTSEIESDYEKRIERNIQEKINAIREQVKREIASLKAEEMTTANGQQRKKREVVNTLLDEENINLDPGLNPDETMKPLVRRRRENTSKRKKRETDFSDIFENEEYEAAEEPEEKPYQEKRNPKQEIYEKKLKQKIIDSRREVNEAPTENPTDQPNTLDDRLIEAPLDMLQVKNIKEPDETADAVVSPRKHIEEEHLNNVEKRKIDKENVFKDLETEKETDLSKDNKRDVVLKATEYYKNKLEQNIDNMASDDKPYTNHFRREIKDSDRAKRGSVPLEDSIFIPYHDEDDEMEDEGDEFEDGSIEGTNLLRKRQTEHLPSQIYYQKRSLDYDPDYDSQQNPDDDLQERSPRKTNEAQKGVSKMNSDVFEDPAKSYTREKRQDEDQLAAFRSGGPLVNHLSAVRERSQFDNEDSREKQKVKRMTVEETEKQEPRQLIEMSDSDLFGALPQSFEGGLSRFKRVKRTPPEQNAT